jgi:hypothetical protein
MSGITPGPISGTTAKADARAKAKAKEKEKEKAGLSTAVEMTNLWWA